MNERINQFLYSNRGENFKNFVFGFQDGLITTYILLIGIAALILFNPTLLILTLIAEVAAGAISMMFGAYISTKTKREALLSSIKNKQTKDLNNELQKFTQTYKLKELEIERIKEFCNENPEICKKLLFDKEIDDFDSDPVNNGMLMGLAFVCGGLLPIIPYFFPMPAWSFVIATFLSFSALLAVGIFRSFYSEKHWIIPALEMVLIGIIAVILIEIYLYFIMLAYGLVLYG